MITSNRYMPFALVALAASTLGWGVSTLVNKETSAVTAAQTVPVAQPSLQPLPPQTIAPEQLASASAPITISAPAQQPAPTVIVKDAPAPVVRTVPVRTRTVTQPETAAADTSPSAEPVRARKKGLSNKTKTAIAIGGAAGFGAAIGGIAGGGKGAALGALIGGGSGAVYSVIRHKQHKPVF